LNTPASTADVEIAFGRPWHFHDNRQSPAGFKNIGGGHKGGRGRGRVLLLINFASAEAAILADVLPHDAMSRLS